MEHKTWLWRKKSSDKTIVESEKGNISSRGSEQEVMDATYYNHANFPIAYLGFFIF